MIQSINMDMSINNIQSQISYENFIIAVHSEISEESVNFKSVINIILQRYEKAFHRILDIIVDLLNKTILFLSKKSDKQLADSIIITDRSQTWTIPIPELTIGIDTSIVHNAHLKVISVVNDTIDTIGAIETAEAVMDNDFKRIVKMKGNVVSEINTSLNNYDRMVFTSPLFSNTLAVNTIEGDGSVFITNTRRALKDRLCGDSKHKYPMKNYDIDVYEIMTAKDMLSNKYTTIIKSLSDIKRSISQIRKLQKKSTVARSVISLANGLSSTSISENTDTIQNMYRTMHVHKMSIITVIQSMYMVTMEYTINFKTVCSMLLNAYNRSKI